MNTCVIFLMSSCFIDTLLQRCTQSVPRFGPSLQQWAHLKVIVAQQSRYILYYEVPLMGYH